MRQRAANRNRVSRASAAATSPTARRQKLYAIALGAAVISGLTVLAYAPSLNGGFLSDDRILLTKSPLIHAPDGLVRFWFTTEPIDYWPMTNTSFWIEWRLWGMNPAGYRVTNLALHLASALLIWWVLSELSIPGAWLAALLFAVHPVNVESVAWIAQRKNTFSMFFFLVSILWYLKSEATRREPSGEAHSPARLVGPTRWYWLSLVAFLLAMLSKGSVAILPLVLLGLAWWRRGRIDRADLWRSAPFFFVAIVLTVVNVWFQKHGAGIELRSAGFGERLAGAGAVVWFYLYKALLPIHLAFVYPQWEIDATNWRCWVPLAAAVVLSAVLIWKRDNPWIRSVLFAWAFFCVALVPVMGFTDVGFMQQTLVSDHYQYVALIAVVALVAAATSTLFCGLTELRRSAVAVGTTLVVCALVVLSSRQSRLYGNPVELYEQSLSQGPNSRIAHNLGTLYLERGQSERAIAYFEQSLKWNPDYPEAHNNLGGTLLRAGRLSEAVEHFEQALRVRPRYAEAHNNLGTALANLGQIQEAIDHLQQAVELNPNYSDAQLNLAKAYGAVNRPADAIATAQRALELARSTGQIELARGIQTWLDNYRAQAPNTQTTPTAPNSTSPRP